MKRSDDATDPCAPPCRVLADQQEAEDCLARIRWIAMLVMRP